MKFHRVLIATAMSMACGAALAVEYGSVLSSTPVVQQVAVSTPMCQDQLQPLQPATSGGAVLGALVGGALGNAIGQGPGRAAVTGLGVIAGAVVGDRVEANGALPGETIVRNCQAAVRYENRLLGYDVFYEYLGQRYSARLAQDPGDRIALNVNVTPVAAAVAAPTVSPVAPTYPAVVYAQPVYTPVPLIVGGAAYYGPGPYYGPTPYYGAYGYGPLISVVPRFVIGGGGRGGGGGRRGHWR